MLFYESEINMKKLILTLVFSVSFGVAEECKLSHESMVLIAKVEKHPKRKLGYPYLISFNKEKDAIKAQKKYKQFFIPNKGVDRTIDCQSEEMCRIILSNLVKDGITNLDLGAFQINYIYHKMKDYEYFRVAESYEYACSYAQSFIEEYGSTFKALAMYHSKTPKYRNKYAKRLYDEYKKSN